MDMQTKEAEEAPKINLRVLQKTRTHELLLRVAKQEFVTWGYRDADLRHIAKLMDASTGVIFGHFKSKKALFVAVAKDDWHTGLSIRFSESTSGSLLEVLTCFFGADYERQASQPQLFRDVMSLWWAGDLLLSAHMEVVEKVTKGFVQNELMKCIEAGESLKHADVAFVGNMVWDAYIGMYLESLSKPMSLAAMCEGLRIKLKVIINSC